MSRPSTTLQRAQQHYHPIHSTVPTCPADVESPMPEGYSTVETLGDHGWLPIRRNALPFPRILAASTDVPLCNYERAVGIAKD